MQLLSPLILPTPFTVVDRHAFPAHIAGGGAAPASPPSPRGLINSNSATALPLSPGRSVGAVPPPSSPMPASPRSKKAMTPAAGWESPKQGGSGLHGQERSDTAGNLGIGSQVGVMRGWSTNIGVTGLQQLGRFEAVPRSVNDALETGAQAAAPAP